MSSSLFRSFRVFRWFQQRRKAVVQNAASGDSEEDIQLAEQTIGEAVLSYPASGRERDVGASRARRRERNHPGVFWKQRSFKTSSKKRTYNSRGNRICPIFRLNFVSMYRIIYQLFPHGKIFGTVFHRRHVPLYNRGKPLDETLEINSRG